MLRCTGAEWDVFVGGVKSSEFDSHEAIPPEVSQ